VIIHPVIRMACDQVVLARGGHILPSRASWQDDALIGGCEILAMIAAERRRFAVKRTRSWRHLPYTPNDASFARRAAYYHGAATRSLGSASSE
jgi:hypothetical protein